MRTNLLPKKKPGKGTAPTAATKGTAPTAAATKIDNLAKAASNELEQLNLKIPADKKLEMVIFGKQRKMTLTDGQRALTFSGE